MDSVSYDQRTIGLLSEIIHPPLELQAAEVQAIHNELYQTAEFSYQNFSVSHEGVTLSNPVEEPNAVSSCNFLPDRIQIREELGGSHIDDFCQRLQHLLSIATERLNLPILVAQQHVVRSLVNSRNFQDSRDFLAGAVCSLQGESFMPFERPVGLFGMKMIFPQHEHESDVHTLRIESFNQDPRCVFLEDVATFTDAVMPDALEKLGENMKATYDFVRQKALAFLASYDRPRN